MIHEIVPTTRRRPFHRSQNVKYAADTERETLNQGKLWKQSSREIRDSAVNCWCRKEAAAVSRAADELLLLLLLLLLPLLLLVARHRLVALHPFALMVVPPMMISKHSGKAGSHRKRV